MTVEGHPVFLRGPAIPLGERPRQAVEVTGPTGLTGRGATTVEAEANLRHLSDARGRADALAKQFGFPPDRVELNYGDPDTVLIGGESLGPEAGHFDPRTGHIVISMKNQYVEQALDPGTMAHEVMHAKYQRAMNEYRHERAALGRDPTRLTADEATRFPTLAALHGDLEGDGLVHLAQEDGISSYSHEYWGQVYSSMEARRGGMALAQKADTALTETQAEWNRLEYEWPRGVHGASLVLLDRARQAHPRSYHLFQHLTSEYARLGPG